MIASLAVFVILFLTFQFVNKFIRFTKYDRTHDFQNIYFFKNFLAIWILFNYKASARRNFAKNKL